MSSIKQEVDEEVRQLRCNLVDLKEELHKEEEECNFLRKREKMLEKELQETKASIEKKKKIAEGLNRVMEEKNDSVVKLTAIADKMKKLCEEERQLQEAFNQLKNKSNLNPLDEEGGRLLYASPTSIKQKKVTSASSTTTNDKDLETEDEDEDETPSSRPSGNNGSQATPDAVKSPKQHDATLESGRKAFQYAVEKFSMLPAKFPNNISEKEHATTIMKNSPSPIRTLNLGLRRPLHTLPDIYKVIAPSTLNLVWEGKCTEDVVDAAPNDAKKTILKVKEAVVSIFRGLEPSQRTLRNGTDLSFKEWYLQVYRSLNQSRFLLVSPNLGYFWKYPSLNDELVAFFTDPEKVAKDTYAQLDKLYKEKLPKLESVAKRQKTESESKKGEESTNMGI